MSLYRHRETGSHVSFLTMTRLGQGTHCAAGDFLEMRSDDNTGSSVLLFPAWDDAIRCVGQLSADQSAVVVVTPDGSLLTMSHLDFTEHYVCVGAEEAIYDITRPVTPNDLDEIEEFALPRSRANAHRVRRAALIIMRLCRELRGRQEAGR